jgi:hypothetical protein
MQARAVSDWRRGGRYPFGNERCWAGAALAAGPIWFPSALFLFSFPFSFSDFYLLHIICKNVSNQFKPISKNL